MSEVTVATADSKERVALELMQKVAVYEATTTTQNRDYWFKLYRQCHELVVLGYKEDDLKK